MVYEIEQDLKSWLADAKKVVLAGIGNPIRADDSVGLKIVENLKGKLPTSVLLVEAETVPESYLSDIEAFHPTHVLLIDAAFLGLKPGSASLVDAEKIAETSLSQLICCLCGFSATTSSRRQARNLLFC